MSPAKPAPTTPLTTLKFGELCARILPPGVVNVITDQNDLGAVLTAHPDVAQVAVAVANVPSSSLIGAGVSIPPGSDPTNGTDATLSGAVTGNGLAVKSTLDRFFVTLAGRTNAKPDLSGADGDLFNPFGA